MVPPVRINFKNKETVGEDYIKNKVTVTCNVYETGDAIYFLVCLSNRFHGFLWEDWKKRKRNRECYVNIGMIFQRPLIVIIRILDQG